MLRSDRNATSGDPTFAISVDRADPRPLATQIAEQIRTLAMTGRLGEATRLPSTRRLAADLGISRGIAEQAWDQLRAEGWLTSRPGSGTWLTVESPVRPANTPATAHPARTPAAPGATAELVMMDAGTPWRDGRQQASWRRAWREVSTAAAPRGYDDPLGLLELRIALAERLTRTRGLAVGPDDVLVTGGTTAGLRQLLTALAPGPVAIEDPGYRAAVLTVQVSGRTALSLPVGEDHVDLTGISGAYVTPAHQHPLGRVMPADQRLALIDSATRADCVVIEDDYDSEFRYDVAPVPALAALAPGRVAYLGTASKIVLPTMRLGWMVLPDSLRGQVNAFRAITHDVPPWPVQRAFSVLLRDGHVDAVVRNARRIYAQRAPKVVAALAPYAELAGPVAGMYSTWLLPHDRAVRARNAAQGAGFRVNLLSDYCRESDLTGLVVGFGGPDDEQLEAALAVLAEALES